MNHDELQEALESAETDDRRIKRQELAAWVADLRMRCGSSLTMAEMKYELWQYLDKYEMQDQLHLLEAFINLHAGESCSTRAVQVAMQVGYELGVAWI